MQFHGPGSYLAHEGRVGADQELLAGLATGVEGARHLSSSEGPVIQQAPVVTGERDSLGGGLVDDVDRDLG